MGRLHLSSAYAIDAPRASTPPVVAPPMFVDAPFDLDADHSDVVYEAFLSPHQISEREEHQVVPMAIDEQARAASPVDSVATSDASESVISAGIQADPIATLTESHPMEDWLGRYGFIPT